MTPAPADAWRAKCRRAEEFGYDVILVPDHLGMSAPFPALVAATEASEQPRPGTFVLNAGFWNPALLAREVATTDALTRGRLELGLGTGYVKAEHDTAGPPGAPLARVDLLRRTIEESYRLLGSAETPAAAGAAAAGAAARRRQRRAPAAPDRRARRHRGLHGSALGAGQLDRAADGNMAAQVPAQRERGGFTCLTVLEPSREAFVPVMARMRADRTSAWWNSASVPAARDVIAT